MSPGTTEHCQCGYIKVLKKATHDTEHVSLQFDNYYDSEDALTSLIQFTDPPPPREVTQFRLNKKPQFSIQQYSLQNAGSRDHGLQGSRMGNADSKYSLLATDGFWHRRMKRRASVPDPPPPRQRSRVTKSPQKRKGKMAMLAPRKRKVAKSLFLLVRTSKTVGCRSPRFTLPSSSKCQTLKNSILTVTACVSLDRSG